MGTVQVCNQIVQVTVPVTISDTAGRTDCSFSVSFDNTKLEYTGKISGDMDAGLLIASTADINAAGKVQPIVTFADGGPVTGTIVTLKFNLLTAINEGSKLDLTIGDLEHSTGSGECSRWADVIAKYNLYVSGQASWSNVMACYQSYDTNPVTFCGISGAIQCCTYPISPASQSFSSNGGAGSVNVTTTNVCSWTATSNASWITITSGSSGTGNGTVSYSVSANTTFNSRTGTITVAGETFTVNQEACTSSISPISQSFAPAGGTGSIVVTSQSSCTWTATSNAYWITITSGNSGVGNGNLNYTVAANSGSSRVGTITIEGETFTVTQEGSPTAECSNWADVIAKYNAYVGSQASWNDVITCYNQYAS